MSEVYLRYLNLSVTVKGLTVQDEEGNYNIYLNPRHTYQALNETLDHEINHITNNDFQKFLHIKDIEK